MLKATGTKLSAVRASYFQENVHNSVAPAKGAGIFPNMTPSADYPMPMIATRDIGTVAAFQLMFPPTKSEVVDLAGPSYSLRQVAEQLGTVFEITRTTSDAGSAERLDGMQAKSFP